MVHNFIEQKALNLLSELELPLPIDPHKCAEFLGVKVSSSPLEEDVSGFLVVKGNEAHIGVNASHSQHRNRFTVAHEIGHFILHTKKDTPVFIDKVRYNRDKRSTTGEYSVEREANAFAAALLMPTPILEASIKQMTLSDPDKLVEDLANQFDVSTQAMRIRLTNLGILDYDL